MATVTPNQIQLSEGHKKEIWEMAVLMADDENPSEREIVLNLPHAKEVVDGISKTMDWITGKSPRPNRKPFKEWINELIIEIEAERDEGERCCL